MLSPLWESHSRQAASQARQPMQRDGSTNIVLIAINNSSLIVLADPVPAAGRGPASNLRYAARAPIPFPGDYVGSAMHGTALYAVWCVSTRPARGRFHQVAYGASLRVR